MQYGKYLGLDGFLIEFYKTFFNKFEMFNEWFHSLKLPPTLNQASVLLISSYHPRSLQSIDVKLSSKLLAMYTGKLLAIAWFIVCLKPLYSSIAIAVDPLASTTGITGKQF